jgi:16S rRNA (adenine1518-N6/adenine1519-N6)-dimethyltransferase
LSLKAKKSLGQHFLADRQISERIASSLDAGPDSGVIEIGPGTGALTGFLYKKFNNLMVIEIDIRAVELISKMYPGINIINDDILNVNWNELVPAAGKIFIIGNLPYYLTSPILFKVLDSQHHFHEAVFMIQKEVGERLVAAPRTKAYGILSVQVQRLSEISLLFNVPREAFRPVPDVESCVVKMRLTGRNCSVH